uniref:Fish-egg lectin-like n=1 Tax=Myripristis murdjan TaxID=586833 RepID=A0A668AGV1_9TELE
QTSSGSRGKDNMQTIAAFMLVLCHLGISQALNCTEAPRLSYATQVDAGLGQVVARNRYNWGYLLMRSSWYSLPYIRIRHVSVGHAGIWAVDTSFRVYQLQAQRINFSPTLGFLKQVDAGGNVFAVGVSSQSNASCLSTGSILFSGRTDGWTQVRSGLTYYSCGLYGCWGVGTRGQVYVTENVTPSNCTMSGWTHVPGLSLKMVEVGSDGRVFGVTLSGEVYERTGIDSARRQGLRWTQHPMCMSMVHVSYDLGRLWVVSTSGLMMQCTI